MNALIIIYIFLFFGLVFVFAYRLKSLQHDDSTSFNLHLKTDEINTESIPQVVEKDKWELKNIELEKKYGKVIYKEKFIYSIPGQYGIPELIEDSIIVFNEAQLVIINQSTIIPFENIMSYSVYDRGSGSDITSHKLQLKSNGTGKIGGALIGGALGGIGGAAIGASLTNNNYSASGVSETRPQEHNYVMFIKTDMISNPCIELKIGWMDYWVEQVASILDIIIRNNTCHK